MVERHRAESIQVAFSTIILRREENYGLDYDREASLKSFLFPTPVCSRKSFEINHATGRDDTPYSHNSYAPFVYTGPDSDQEPFFSHTHLNLCHKFRRVVKEAAAREGECSTRESGLQITPSI